MHEYGDYGVLWQLVLERTNNNGYIIIFHVLSRLGLLDNGKTMVRVLLYNNREIKRKRNR